MNEIQLAVTGLRTELLSVATSYGLMRTAETELEDQLGDWREWLAYTRRLDAWVRGAKDGIEMSQKLDEASHIPDELLDEQGEESASADWWYGLVALTEAARSVEDLSVPGKWVAPMNEIPDQTPAGFALLGAIEDSLILELAGGPDNQAWRTTSAEIYELLVQARAEGVWEWMEPNTEQHAPPAVRAPESDQPDRPEAIELTEALLVACRESVDFYRRLYPDGRELTEIAQRGAIDQLVTGAVWLRRVAKAESAFAAGCAIAAPSVDLARMVAAWRRIQRSLVLAISEEPNLRSRAHPAASHVA